MLSILIYLVGLCTAVFREDAGLVDWKLAVYGKPLFLASHNGSLAAVTDAGVVTVYSPEGIVYWRQKVEGHQTENGIAFDGDVVLLGGDYLQAFNASDGVSLWTVNDPPSKVVYNHQNSFFCANYVVSPTGDLKETTASAESAGPIRVESSTTKLDDGSVLNVSPQGVLTLYNASNEVRWTREDGLSTAVNACFLKPEQVQEDHTQAERYLNLAFANDNTHILKSFVIRSSHHIGEFAAYLLKFVSGPGIAKLFSNTNNQQYGFDQVLVVQTDLGSIYGLNATSGIYAGSELWVYHDLEPVSIENVHPSEVQVKSRDGSVYVINWEGDVIRTFVESDSVKERLASVEINGNELHSLQFGWRLTLPGSEVVAKAERSSQDITALVAVPIGDDEVMYKYLNPYTAVFASYDKETKLLAFTVLDTASGRILGQSFVADPVVINEEWPMTLVFGEYWFAATYLSLDAMQTPKLMIGELFESVKPNQRFSKAENDVMLDSSLPVLMTASWEVPYGQAVYSSTVSRSLHGAVSRDLVLALENSIISISKLQLSALNRSPTLEVKDGNHISHIAGVSRAKKLVVSTTNLESTYLLAAVGGPDLFVTRIAPSGEIDKLHSKFPKIKLVLLLGLLGFVVSTLSPLARLKLLRREWT